jgi:VanZ family protein
MRLWTLYNTRMTQKKRKHRWVWLLVAAYIAFIFHNSMMVASASSALSTKVAMWLARFLQNFGLYVADFSLFHHYIRKLAHFTEFAGLGVLVGIAMHVSPLFRHRALNFLVFLFAVPFADEMIQRFYDGRSSQFTDMFIDAGGFVFGGFCIYLLLLLLTDLFHSRR